MRTILCVVLLSILASSAHAGSVYRTITKDTLAAQTADSTGILTISTGCTRIDFDLSGSVGKNFKATLRYKTTGNWSVVWTSTNVSASAARFSMQSSWDGPFAANAQYRLIVENLHASSAVTGLSMRVRYDEPDTW